ncbi:hypothetical protein F5B21DRAFT_509113 [Xylaria acuta]|nr:hypothetical protein F5B21DRAFT_509113 [Xylaria acuta]
MGRKQTIQLDNDATLTRSEPFKFKLRSNAHVGTLLVPFEDLMEFAEPDMPANRLQAIFTTLGGLGGSALAVPYPVHYTERTRILALFPVVRACIGPAYPRDPDDATGAPEEIPADKTAGDLVHGDIAGRNMVIGDTDPSTPEHSMVPILKMIDSGGSRECANTGKGVEENLHFAAVAASTCPISQSRSIIANKVEQEMLILIRKGPVRTRLQRNAMYFESVRTVATDTLPGVNGMPRFPNLDPRLRNLLVLAVRTDRDRRPSLATEFGGDACGYAERVGREPGY